MHGDFVLWVQRFELYLEEAEVPPAKRVRELVSLLDDRPFRYVSQLGLLTSDSYETVRSELRKQYCPVVDETEWLFRLQSRRQKSAETLAEFAGELRMLADRAYPDWKVEQRMEMVKKQFVQGVRSLPTQLALMKEKPKSLETALELAQTHEVVETAQKRLHASQMVATLSKFNEDSVAGETSGTTNALQTNERNDTPGIIPAGQATLRHNCPFDYARSEQRQAEALDAATTKERTCLLGVRGAGTHAEKLPKPSRKRERVEEGIEQESAVNVQTEQPCCWVISHGRWVHRKTADTNVSGYRLSGNY